MNAPDQAPAIPAQCLPLTCRAGNAMEVIDSLLRAAGAVRGDEVDGLLDLRWLLRNRQDGEGALALFCQLRRAMEERHYLAFYRLRQWLQNHVEAKVRVRRGEPDRAGKLKLDRYCIEAIHHQCLQSVLQPGEQAQAPRVQFHFREARAEGGDAPAAPRAEANLISSQE